MTKQPKHITCTPELSRLISAAVVSPSFCRLLLQNPAAALESGYMGKPFNLSAEEQALVCSIRATALDDFASQLVHGMAEGHTSLPATAGVRADSVTQPGEDRLAHTFVRQNAAPDSPVEEEGCQEVPLLWEVHLELVAEPA